MLGLRLSDGDTLAVTVLLGEPDSLPDVDGEPEPLGDWLRVGELVPESEAVPDGVPDVLGEFDAVTLWEAVPEAVTDGLAVSLGVALADGVTLSDELCVWDGVGVPDGVPDGLALREPLRVPV